MEKKMMQKSVRYTATAAIIPASLLSVVFSNFCRSLQCCASKKLDMLQR
jgi:hypothetical protein